MTEYTFKANLGNVCALDCFKDATKDELKVLLAIISLNGEPSDADKLSEMTGVSRARVLSTITLFEESGVLCKITDDFLAEVEYEFDKNLEESKKIESKQKIAKSIRENDLYEMNTEIERILEKTLEVREIARITSLHTKDGLSPEYILTLAAYIKDRSRLVSVEKIVREAKKLISEEIDTLEDLEIYIEKKNEEIAGEMEMRHLFGIFDRTLTKTERSHFKRWMHEFGYSAVIIGEAYDISVAAINKLSLSYINSILSEWHASGCTTLDECRAKSNAKKYESKKKANNSSQRNKKSVEAETPKYTEFNSEDALLRALERSYSDQADTTTEDKG